MKKQIILLTLLMAITHISAQEIINNTDKPLSKKTGRAIEFKVELRIKDVDRDTQGLGNMLKIQPHAFEIPSSEGIVLSLSLLEQRDFNQP